MPASLGRPVPAEEKARWLQVSRSSSCEVSGEGQSIGCCDGFQSGKRRASVFLGRDGPLQQTNDLADRHCRRIGIARRPTKPQQEAAVSRNAIAHFAEAGEVDKEPLLEERWDRGVQIGRLRELPQFANNEGRVRRRAEKIRNKTKARCDLALEVFLAARLGIRCVSGKSGTIDMVTPFHCAHTYGSRSCTSITPSCRLALRSPEAFPSVSPLRTQADDASNATASHTTRHASNWEARKRLPRERRARLVKIAQAVTSPLFKIHVGDFMWGALSPAGSDHQRCCSRRKYRSSRKPDYRIGAPAALRSRLRAPAALGPG